MTVPRERLSGHYFCPFRDSASGGLWPPRSGMGQEERSVGRLSRRVSPWTFLLTHTTLVGESPNTKILKTGLSTGHDLRLCQKTGLSTGLSAILDGKVPQAGLGGGG